MEQDYSYEVTFQNEDTGEVTSQIFRGPSFDYAYNLAKDFIGPRSAEWEIISIIKVD